MNARPRLIPLHRTPEPGFQKPFCWKQFPHAASAVKSRNGAELIVHRVNRLGGRKSSLPFRTNAGYFVSPPWILCAWGVFLGSLVLLCAHPPLCFTSWSYLTLGSKTTESQRSTWGDDSQQFCGRVPTRTRPLTRTRVCNSIVLTSWQKACTTGFPRQQVCKISHLHHMCTCLDIEYIIYITYTGDKKDEATANAF